jgi:flavodoxin I
MPDALIAFASFSGSTRDVAGMIAARLPGMTVRSLELSVREPPDIAALPPRPDLVLLGTPTYGKGEWHAAWSAHGMRLLPVLREAGRIMLFALGDARAHAETFAGGLARLHGFVRDAGLRSVGGTLPVHETEYASPAIFAGRFPGLVLEYRLRRREAGARLDAWLSGLPPPWLRDSPPHTPGLSAARAASHGSEAIPLPLSG